MKTQDAKAMLRVAMVIHSGGRALTMMCTVIAPTRPCVGVSYAATTRAVTEIQRLNMYHSLERREYGSLTWRELQPEPGSDNQGPQQPEVKGRATQVKRFYRMPTSGSGQ